MWRPAQHRLQKSRRNRAGRHITACATEDPPYHPQTLSSQGQLYRFTMTAGEHADLLLRLRQCKARVLLCGYPHATYDALLSDWVQLERSTRCVMGARGPRTERVWMNYELPGAGGVHG